ncbi:pilus assembly protein TadG-related protein [Paenibacillus sp. GD4]|uniref:pilus assembly protein TadG-related protein n=1 Tax=Paenibacillus sp. GD4 TaxID=3068890 RepID=UPI0027964C57|nr:pilus assembly protein TadG-related protein [Paenibacillus sp. GD4]MDQ1911066.1 pilus assembly protein TadG-related protein [Paenibacillus sp. GD4]
MRTRGIALVRQQEGSSLVLAALLLAGLLATAALVVDGGILFVTKSHLQKTANAAVLSGAQELTRTQEQVSGVIQTVLQMHEEHTHVQSTSVSMGQKVSVSLRKEVPLGFARMFGWELAPVQAKATAEIGVMGSAVGAAPLGINENIPLEYGRVYKLKVDQTQVEAGNFGVLALGGTGASTYEDNLRRGYSSELKIGTVIDTQTGNIAGKTREGVRLRLDECPYPPGETHHRDCPRILLIPVYREIESQGNQLKNVMITGFSYFYIMEPMSANDTSISGMFIQRADTGIVDPGAVSRGAYAIRLTE